MPTQRVRRPSSLIVMAETIKQAAATLRMVAVCLECERLNGEDFDALEHVWNEARALENVATIVTDTAGRRVAKLNKEGC